MPEEYYPFDEDEPPQRGRDNLFLWTVFILLLVGLAFGCWLGSFYVFGHPEQPRPYRLLKKLGKIDAPKRFEVTQAPQGDFLSPQRAFDRYSIMSRLELERENAELLRNYIKNYRETKKKVVYLTGRYEILNSYELQKSDLFQVGVVALAQSIDTPQVLVEHVYPAPVQKVPALRTMLQTGLDLKMERTLDLGAVIHVERTFDGRLQFTVVPLLYGTYALKQGVGTFSLEPPLDLNIGAGVPILKGKTLQEAVRGYADYRRKKPAVPETPEGTTAPPGPELVRLDTVKPGDAVPETGAMVEAPVATPIPMAGTRITAVATPRGTPTVLAARTTPAPPFAPTGPIIARATPVPAVIVPATPPVSRIAAAPTGTPLPTLSPQGVPLKPFIMSQPAPGLTGADNSWTTFAPGQQPRGRVITLGEASALAGRGDLGERLYLQGSFKVTATGENRVVLRSQGASGDPRQPESDSARVMVQFPASAAPPPLGSSFARDEMRPFEILDVRKGPDGQINIYVREVTQPTG